MSRWLPETLYNYNLDFTLAVIGSLLLCTILYRFIYSHGASTLGFLVSKSVNYVAGSKLTSFKLGKLNLGTLPYIEDFECTIKSNKQYVADYSIKFKKVRVEIKWNPLLVPFYNTIQGVVQRSCVEYNKWCCRFTLLHQWGLMKAPVPLKTKKERRKGVGRKMAKQHIDKTLPRQAMQTLQEVSADVGENSLSNLANVSYEGRRRSLTDTKLADRVVGASINTPMRRRATSTLSRTESPGGAQGTGESRTAQVEEVVGAGGDTDDVAPAGQEMDAASDDNKRRKTPPAASESAYNVVSDKIIQIIFTDLEVSGDKLTYLDLLGSSLKKKTGDGSDSAKNDDSTHSDSDSDHSNDNENNNEGFVDTKKHADMLSSQSEDNRSNKTLDKKPENDRITQETPVNTTANESETGDGPEKETEKEIRRGFFGFLGLTDFFFATLKFRIRLFFMREVDMQFENISFRLNLPVEGLYARGTCRNMIIHALDGQSRHKYEDGMLGRIEMYQCILLLEQNSRKAASLRSKAVVLDVDVYVPTGKQDISVSLGYKNKQNPFETTTNNNPKSESDLFSQHHYQYDNEDLGFGDDYAFETHNTPPYMYGNNPMGTTDGDEYNYDSDTYRYGSDSSATSSEDEFIDDASVANAGNNYAARERVGKRSNSNMEHVFNESGNVTKGNKSLASAGSQMSSQISKKFSNGNDASVADTTPRVGSSGSQSSHKISTEEYAAGTDETATRRHNGRRSPKASPNQHRSNTRIDSNTHEVLQVDRAEVWIVPFLSFYKKYSAAEDDIIELKMASFFGVTIISSMRSMRANIQVMYVNLHHHALKNSNVMLLQRMNFDLSNYVVDSDNQDVLSYKKSKEVVNPAAALPLDESGTNHANDAHAEWSSSNQPGSARQDDKYYKGQPQLRKRMNVTLGRVLWPYHNTVDASISHKNMVNFINKSGGSEEMEYGNSSGVDGNISDAGDASGVDTEGRPSPFEHHTTTSIARCYTGRQVSSQCRIANVEGIRYGKVLHIYNRSPFYDDDEQEISVGRVNLLGVDPELMHWLFVLQDMSDKLPFSRFSHLKRVTMNISIPFLVFGSEPKHDTDPPKKTDSQKDGTAKTVKGDNQNLNKSEMTSDSPSKSNNNNTTSDRGGGESSADVTDEEDDTSYRSSDSGGSKIHAGSAAYHTDIFTPMAHQPGDIYSSGREARERFDCFASQRNPDKVQLEATERLQQYWQMLTATYAPTDSLPELEAQHIQRLRETAMQEFLAVLSSSSNPRQDYGRNAISNQVVFFVQGLRILMTRAAKETTTQYQIAMQSTELKSEVNMKELMLAHRAVCVRNHNTKRNDKTNISKYDATTTPVSTRSGRADLFGRSSRGVTHRTRRSSSLTSTGSLSTPNLVDLVDAELNRKPEIASDDITHTGDQNVTRKEDQNTSAQALLEDEESDNESVSSSSSSASSAPTVEALSDDEVNGTRTSLRTGTSPVNYSTNGRDSPDPRVIFNNKSHDTLGVFEPGSSPQERLRLDSFNSTGGLEYSAYTRNQRTYSERSVDSTGGRFRSGTRVRTLTSDSINSDGTEILDNANLHSPDSRENGTKMKRAATTSSGERVGAHFYFEAVEVSFKMGGGMWLNHFKANTTSVDVYSDFDQVQLLQETLNDKTGATTSGNRERTQSNRTALKQSGLVLKASREYYFEQPLARTNSFSVCWRGSTNPLDCQVEMDRVLLDFSTASLLKFYCCFNNAIAFSGRVTSIMDIIAGLDKPFAKKNLEYRAMIQDREKTRSFEVEALRQWKHANNITAADEVEDLDGMSVPGMVISSEDALSPLDGIVLAEDLDAVDAEQRMPELTVNFTSVLVNYAVETPSGSKDESYIRNHGHTHADEKGKRLLAAGTGKGGTGANTPGKKGLQHRHRPKAMLYTEGAHLEVDRHYRRKSVSTIDTSTSTDDTTNADNHGLPSSLGGGKYSYGIRGTFIDTLPLPAIYRKQRDLYLEKVVVRDADKNSMRETKVNHDTTTTNVDTEHDHLTAKLFGTANSGDSKYDNDNEATDSSDDKSHSDSDFSSQYSSSFYSSDDSKSYQSSYNSSSSYDSDTIDSDDDVSSATLTATSDSDAKYSDTSSSYNSDSSHSDSRDVRRRNKNNKDLWRDSLSTLDSEAQSDVFESRFRVHGRGSTTNVVGKGRGNKKRKGSEDHSKRKEKNKKNEVLQKQKVWKLSLKNFQCKNLVDTGTVADPQDPKLIIKWGFYKDGNFVQLGQHQTRRQKDAGVNCAFPESFDIELPVPQNPYIFMPPALRPTGVPATTASYMDNKLQGADIELRFELVNESIFHTNTGIGVGRTLLRSTWPQEDMGKKKGKDVTIYLIHKAVWPNQSYLQGTLAMKGSLQLVTKKNTPPPRTGDSVFGLIKGLGVGEVKRLIATDAINNNDTVEGDGRGKRGSTEGGKNKQRGGRSASNVTCRKVGKILYGVSERPTFSRRDSQGARHMRAHVTNLNASKKTEKVHHPHSHSLSHGHHGLSPEVISQVGGLRSSSNADDEESVAYSELSASTVEDGVDSLYSSEYESEEGEGDLEATGDTGNNLTGDSIDDDDLYLNEEEQAEMEADSEKLLENMNELKRRLVDDGVYFNLEFTGFVYRSINDMNVRRIGSVEVNVTELRDRAFGRPYFPIKSATYSWNEAMIRLNNHPGKPLFRIRSFAFKTTSHHVDVTMNQSMVAEVIEDFKKSTTANISESDVYAEGSMENEDAHLSGDGETGDEHSSGNDLNNSDHENNSSNSDGSISSSSYTSNSSESSHSRFSRYSRNSYDHYDKYYNSDGDSVNTTDDMQDSSHRKTVVYHFKKLDEMTLNIGLFYMSMSPDMDVGVNLDSAIRQFNLLLESFKKPRLIKTGSQASSETTSATRIALQRQSSLKNASDKSPRTSKNSPSRSKPVGGPGDNSPEPWRFVEGEDYIDSPSSAGSPPIRRPRGGSGSSNQFLKSAYDVQQPESNSSSLRARYNTKSTGSSSRGGNLSLYDSGDDEGVDRVSRPLHHDDSDGEFDSDDSMEFERLWALGEVDIDDTFKEEPRSFQVLKIDIQSFRLFLDVEYENQIRPNFLTLSLHRLDLILDSSVGDDHIYKQICALDGTNYPEASGKNRKNDNEFKTSLRGGHDDPQSTASTPTSTGRRNWHKYMMDDSSDEEGTHWMDKGNSDDSNTAHEDPLSTGTGGPSGNASGGVGLGGASEIIDYDKFLGGYLTVSSKRIIIRMETMLEPLLGLQDVCVSGVVYQSGANNAGICKRKELNILSENIDLYDVQEGFILPEVYDTNILGMDNVLVDKGYKNAITSGISMLEELKRAAIRELKEELWVRKLGPPIRAFKSEADGHNRPGDLLEGEYDRYSGRLSTRTEASNYLQTGRGSPASLDELGLPSDYSNNTAASDTANTISSRTSPASQTTDGVPTTVQVDTPRSDAYLLAVEKCTRLMPRLNYLGVYVLKNTAPMKTYGELTLSCKMIHFHVTSKTSEGLDAVFHCAQSLVLPQDDHMVVDVPLAWWDNYRYAYHGSLTLNVEKMIMESIYEARRVDNHHQSDGTYAENAPTDVPSTSNPDHTAAEDTRETHASHGNAATSKDYAAKVRKYPKPAPGSSVLLRFILDKTALCIDHRLLEVASHDVDFTCDYEVPCDRRDLQGAARKGARHIQHSRRQHARQAEAADVRGNATGGVGKGKHRRSYHNGNRKNSSSGTGNRINSYSGPETSAHEHSRTPRRFSINTVPGVPPVSGPQTSTESSNQHLGNTLWVTNTERIAYMPGLLFSMHHTRADRGNFYGHHDIYLRPVSSNIFNEIKNHDLALHQWRAKQRRRAKIMALIDVMECTKKERLAASKGAKSGDSTLSREDLVLATLHRALAATPSDLPPRRQLPDIFQYFRMQKSSLNWNLELVIFDSDVCPVAVNVRLDVLFRAFDPFLNPDAYKAVPQGPVELDSKEVVDASSNTTSNSGSVADGSGGASGSDTPLPADVMALVRKIDLQVHIKRILVFGWQSAFNCQGFAFIQERLDLELRLCRGKTTSGSKVDLERESRRESPQDIDEKKPALMAMPSSMSQSPLQVDHMFCEVDFADLYIRDWAVPKSEEQRRGELMLLAHTWSAHEAADSPHHEATNTTSTTASLSKVSSTDKLANLDVGEFNATVLLNGNKDSNHSATEPLTEDSPRLRTSTAGSQVSRTKARKKSSYAEITFDTVAAHAKVIEHKVRAKYPKDIDRKAVRNKNHGILATQEYQLSHGVILSTPALGHFFIINDIRLTSLLACREPYTLEELQNLFVPLKLCGHTSKLLISLTEGGEVGSRKKKFTSTLANQNLVKNERANKGKTEIERKKQAVYTFTAGSNGPNPVYVTPIRGTMAGMCIAAKKTASLRTVASYLGGKATKRRWYELDGDMMKYCEGRERYPDTFKKAFLVTDIIAVRAYTRNKRLLAETAKSSTNSLHTCFEIDTEQRCYELGCESIFEHDSWLRALENAYYKKTGLNLAIENISGGTDDTRLSSTSIGERKVNEKEEPRLARTMAVKPRMRVGVHSDKDTERHTRGSIVNNDDIARTRVESGDNNDWDETLLSSRDTESDVFDYDPTKYNDTSTSSNTGRRSSVVDKENDCDMDSDDSEQDEEMLQQIIDSNANSKRHNSTSSSHNFNDLHTAQDVVGEDNIGERRDHMSAEVKFHGPQNVQDLRIGQSIRRLEIRADHNASFRSFLGSTTGQQDPNQSNRTRTDLYHDLIGTSGSALHTRSAMALMNFEELPEVPGGMRSRRNSLMSTNSGYHGSRRRSSSRGVPREDAEKRGSARHSREKEYSDMPLGLQSHPKSHDSKNKLKSLAIVADAGQDPLILSPLTNPNSPVLLTSSRQSLSTQVDPTKPSDTFRSPISPLSASSAEQDIDFTRGSVMLAAQPQGRDSYGRSRANSTYRELTNSHTMKVQGKRARQENLKDVSLRKAWLHNFGFNHTTLMPDIKCLPASYEKRKNGSKALDPRQFTKNSHSGETHTDHSGHNKSSDSNNNNDNTTQISTYYGDKIWGLRITDLRLLWSIAIRDVVYSYIREYFDSNENLEDRRLTYAEEKHKSTAEKGNESDDVWMVDTNRQEGDEEGDHNSTVRGKEGRRNSNQSTVTLGPAHLQRQSTYHMNNPNLTTGSSGPKHSLQDQSLSLLEFYRNRKFYRRELSKGGTTLPTSSSLSTGSDSQDSRNSKYKQTKGKGSPRAANKYSKSYQLSQVIKPSFLAAHADEMGLSQYISVNDGNKPDAHRHTHRLATIVPNKGGLTKGHDHVRSITSNTTASTSTSRAPRKGTSGSDNTTISAQNEEPVDYEIDTDNFPRSPKSDGGRDGPMFTVRATATVEVRSDHNPPSSPSQSQQNNSGKSGTSTTSDELPSSTKKGKRDKKRLNVTFGDETVDTTTTDTAGAEVAREIDTDDGKTLTLEAMLRAKNKKEGSSKKDSSHRNNGGSVKIPPSADKKKAHRTIKHAKAGHRNITPRGKSLAQDYSNNNTAASTAEELSQQAKTASARALAAKHVPRRFFFVELVNPQINFLDAKNHSSLITVAGNASLEGKRTSVAVLPSEAYNAYDDYIYNVNGVPTGPPQAGGNTEYSDSSSQRQNRDSNKTGSTAESGYASYQSGDSGADMERREEDFRRDRMKRPKRKVDIVLLMEKISAFTVPTNPHFVTGTGATGTQPTNLTSNSDDNNNNSKKGGNKNTRVDSITDVVHWKRLEHTSAGMQLSTPLSDKNDRSVRPGLNNTPSTLAMKMTPRPSMTPFSKNNTHPVAHMKRPHFSGLDDGHPEYKYNNKTTVQETNEVIDAVVNNQTSLGTTSATVSNDLFHTRMQHKTRYNLLHAHHKSDLPSFQCSHEGAAFGSFLLKEAIRDFDVEANYGFWVDVSREEAPRMIIEDRSSISSVFNLDLRKFEIDVDSDQFIIVTNVTRNVLLEPPPRTHKKGPKRHTPHPSTRGSASGASGSTGEDGDDGGIIDEGENAKENKDSAIEVAFDDYAARALDKEGLKQYTPDVLTSMAILSTNAKKAVAVLIDNSIRNRPNAIEEGIERDVKVTIGEGTWKLKTEDTLETIKIKFTGVEAQFSYHNNRTSTSYFTVQRFKVSRAHDLLMDDYSPYNRPNGNVGTLGYLSNRGFSATAKAKLIETSQHQYEMGEVIEEQIIQPNVHNMQSCTRCNQNFDPETNHSEACRVHMNADGRPGVYANVKIPDPLTGKLQNCKMWSCCNMESFNADPCSQRHHQFKEKMLQISVTTNPPARIGNIDVTVIKEFDIAVFPGAAYDLKLYIDNGLKKSLYRYFRVDQADNVPVADEQAEKMKGHLSGKDNTASATELSEGVVTDSSNTNRNRMLSEVSSPFRDDTETEVVVTATDDRSVIFKEEVYVKESSDNTSTATMYNMKKLPSSYNNTTFSDEVVLKHQQQELDPNYSSPRSSIIYQEAVQEALQQHEAEGNYIRHPLSQSPHRPSGHRHAGGARGSSTPTSASIITRETSNMLTPHDQTPPYRSQSTTVSTTQKLTGLFSGYFGSARKRKEGEDSAAYTPSSHIISRKASAVSDDSPPYDRLGLASSGHNHSHHSITSDNSMPIQQYGEADHRAIEADGRRMSYINKESGMMRESIVDEVPHENEGTKVAKADTTMRELVYIQRFRMGQFRASVDATGFGLDVHDLLAEVDAVTICGDALTWTDLANSVAFRMAYSVAAHAKVSTMIRGLFRWGSNNTTQQSMNNKIASSRDTSIADGRDGIDLNIRHAEEHKISVPGEDDSSVSEDNSVVKTDSPSASWEPAVLYPTTASNSRDDSNSTNITSASSTTTNNTGTKTKSFFSSFFGSKKSTNKNKDRGAMRTRIGSNTRKYQSELQVSNVTVSNTTSSSRGSDASSTPGSNVKEEEHTNKNLNLLLGGRK